MDALGELLPLDTLPVLLKSSILTAEGLEVPSVATVGEAVDDGFGKLV